MKANHIGDYIPDATQTTPDTNPTPNRIPEQHIPGTDIHHHHIFMVMGVASVLIVVIVLVLYFAIR